MIKYLRGDFISQILSAMKLKQNDKKLDLNCLVVRTDIIDGKASFPKGVAFKSNKITIVSDGYVNLKNDAIDLSIKPFNGKLADTNVAQAITSLLKVSGTVQKPRLTIDNSAVIKNVVGIAAAGPAFLGSQMLFDVDDDIPVEGDKVICLRNDWETITEAGDTLVNGAIGTISNLRINKNHPYLRPQLITDFLPDDYTPEDLEVAVQDLYFRDLNMDYKLLTTGEETVNSKNFKKITIHVII